MLKQVRIVKRHVVHINVKTFIFWKMYFKNIFENNVYTNVFEV